MKLKDYLSKYGISLIDFAARIEIHPGHLEACINNRRPFSMNTAYKINKETKGKVSYNDLIIPKPPKHPCPLCQKSTETVYLSLEDAIEALKKHFHKHA